MQRTIAVVFVAIVLAGCGSATTAERATSTTASSTTTSTASTTTATAPSPAPPPDWAAPDSTQLLADMAAQAHALAERACSDPSTPEWVCTDLIEDADRAQFESDDYAAPEPPDPCADDPEYCYGGPDDAYEYDMDYP